MKLKRLMILLCVVLCSGCAGFDASLVPHEGGYKLDTNGKLPRALKVEYVNELKKEKIIISSDSRTGFMENINLSAVNLGGAISKGD